MPVKGNRQYAHVSLVDTSVAEVSDEITDIVREIRDGQIVLEVVDGEVVQIETIQRRHAL